MFSRSLGLNSVDPKDQAVITAWSAVHTEAEALIAQAKGEETGQIQQSVHVSALSPLMQQELQLNPGENC